MPLEDRIKGYRDSGAPHDTTTPLGEALAWVGAFFGKESRPTTDLFSPSPFEDLTDEECASQIEESLHSSYRQLLIAMANGTLNSQDLLGLTESLPNKEGISARALLRRHQNHGDIPAAVNFTRKVYGLPIIPKEKIGALGRDLAIYTIVAVHHYFKVNEGDLKKRAMDYVRMESPSKDVYVPVDMADSIFKVARRLAIQLILEKPNLIMYISQLSDIFLGAVAYDSVREISTHPAYGAYAAMMGPTPSVARGENGPR